MLRILSLCLLSSTTLCWGSGDSVPEKAQAVQHSLQGVMAQVGELVSASAMLQRELDRSNAQCAELRRELAGRPSIATVSPATRSNEYGEISVITYHDPYRAAHSHLSSPPPPRQVHIFNPGGGMVLASLTAIINSNEAFYERFGVLLAENRRLQNELESRSIAADPLVMPLDPAGGGAHGASGAPS